MSDKDLPFEIKNEPLISKVLKIYKSDFESLKEEFPSLSDYELLSLLMQYKNSDSLSIVTESIEELYNEIYKSEKQIIDSKNVLNDNSVIKFKHSINFNLVTTDIDRSRLNEKPIRIKAVIRFFNNTIVISKIAKIVLGSYKIVGGKGGRPVSGQWDFNKNCPSPISENRQLITRLEDFKIRAGEIINRKLSKSNGEISEDYLKEIKVEIESIK